MAVSQYAALKILVVDDFHSFRATLGRLLAEFGCDDVTTVMNGPQALAACRKHKFDVVLCDYNLGEGPNGQQVLEELRQRNLLARDSLFLLVSAESSQAIVLSAYDYSPDAYLTKPINGKSLQQRLDRLLRQRDAMAPIYARLAAGKIDAAIGLAEQAIAAGSRYSYACQRLLGNLYMQQDRISEAEKLYTGVLEMRPLDWAQVGLAQVKRAQGDLPTAIQWLQRIIDDNPFCLPAYDALAEVYRQLGEADKTQQVMQAAVAVSPLSILRQAELAHTAAANRDLEVASRAYGRCVKLGENSCHDHQDNHLQYGRVTAAWIRESQLPNALDLAKDGLRVLGNVPRRFELGAVQRQQVSLLECQLLSARGEDKSAQELLKDVEENIELPGDSLDLQLDLVATLKTLRLDERAEQVLKSLVEQYCGDQPALQRIDLWLEEPVSERNRKLVAELNREGIGFYDANNYARALDSFKRACRLFPHHPGVQLNLLQALVADMKQHGCSGEGMELSASLCQRIQQTVQPGGEEFNRFKQLQQVIKQLH
ncbi:response regulator [Pseudomaricurvus alcaniphilus]|uniref:tetratricopeptide repeat-containing response regulator n=1 Tax=Pseudomaricurvus alcaniphilus TaxID=1166482 RepID=UPI001407A275|nr:tetratricopeptide repeat-containing response regulator [Pseudomaricurvus alcaniphilus]NHN37485.1 response regulator [Pseudomaricurvus alcaniphilus]